MANRLECRGRNRFDSWRCIYDSKTERGELRTATLRLLDSSGELKAQDQKFAAQLVELETQVAKIYGDMNSQNVRNISDIARLWQKTYSEPYPIIPYFPSPRILPQ